MALAITSFPVPVSPWIKTAESTGATLSTSANNTLNFGLDPIKSKLVIALFLFECEMCSRFEYEVVPRFTLIKTSMRLLQRGTGVALRGAECLCSLPFILL
jgi:hypothetical protein